MFFLQLQRLTEKLVNKYACNQSIEFQGNAANSTEVQSHHDSPSSRWFPHLPDSLRPNKILNTETLSAPLVVNTVIFWHVDSLSLSPLQSWRPKPLCIRLAWSKQSSRALVDSHRISAKLPLELTSWRICSYKAPQLSHVFLSQNGSITMLVK